MPPITYTMLDTSSSSFDVELRQLFSGHMRALLASANGPGIGLIDTGILRFLAERGDMRASFLAEEFAVTRTSISRHVAMLVETGLLEQHADPEDGRAIRLGLTAAGRRALAADDERFRTLIAQLTADWSEDERRLAAMFLARFNARAREFAGQPHSAALGGAR